MNIVVFYHSIISDWNHGNAHVLRGIVTAMIHRGCRVIVYEPADGWSLSNVRRPYVKKLPGIPTIRPFEALASGIPLISAPWKDSEGLFKVGRDFLMARDGDEMTYLLKKALASEKRRMALTPHGLRTIRTRHTCDHRVDELLALSRQLRKTIYAAHAKEEEHYAKL
jgi:spore maturation protein CgeB